MSEVMLPQCNTKFSGSVQRRADGQIGHQCGRKSCIEESEPCRKHTGIGLDAADQHTINIQTLDVIDRFGRLRVAVLYKDFLGVNQAAIFYSGAPAKLLLKRRDLFIMQLDRGNRGNPGRERANTLHQPFGRVEGGLDIND